MASLNSSLMIKLIDQVSAPAKKITASIKGIGQNLSGLQNKGMTANLATAIKRNNQHLTAMRGRMIDAAIAGYGLSRAFGAPINAAVGFESALADVAKVTDFDTGGIKKFGEDIRKLSVSEIPMAVDELLGLSAKAAASGIADADLLDFTKLTAKAAIAWDMTGDAAGESLGKIKTALQLSVGETAKFADLINHLDNISASSSSNLVDYIQRVGSVGKTYGFSKEQTLAFGSAMIASGAQADVAATTFRNMGKALTRGEGATKRQSAAFRLLGLNSGKTAKAMQRDAVGTTRDVIKRLQALPAHLRAATISDLFGDEARALGPLLDNTAELEKVLAAAADEQKYLNSVQKEFKIRSETGRFAIQKFKNQINEVALVIGNSLLPGLKQVLEALGPAILAFAQWAEAHPELVRNIIIATGALIGLRVAMIALRTAMLFTKGGVLGLLRPFVALAQGGRNAVALQRSLATLGGFKYSRLRMIGDALKGMVMAIPGMSGLRKVIRPLIGLVGMLSRAFIAAGIAIMTTPVGWIIAGIAAVAAAAYLLYKNWDRVKDAWGRGTSYLAQKWASLNQRVTAESRKMWDHLTKGMPAEKKAALEKNLTDFIREGLFTEKGRAASFALLTELGNGLSGLGQMMYEKFSAAMADAGRAVWEWCKELPANIKKWIGSISLSDIITMPSFGGGGIGPTNADRGKNDFSIPGPDGYAKGGSFRGGGTYLVGEEGPELITPSRSGYVHTAPETRRMLGGKGGGISAASGGVNLSLGSISLTVNGATDPRAIADQVISELQSRIGSALSGIQADIGYTS